MDAHACHGRHKLLLDAPPDESITIVRSRHDAPERDEDVKWIVQEAKKETHALGFLPAVVLSRYYDERLAVVCRNNGDRVGFLVFGTNQRLMRLTIFMCYVRVDARMILHGKFMVNFLGSEFEEFYIKLGCADELPALVFWEAIGFTKMRIRGKKNGNARNRLIHEFEMPPVRAASMLFNRWDPQIGDVRR